MAQEETKDVIKKHKEKEQTMEEVVVAILSQVVRKEITMAVATSKLRTHVNFLSEEAQVEFRAKARPMAMWLMSVAEGFQQELTVIGAGQ